MNENEIKILFGRHIKQLRVNLKLTQFELGEMADINQRQVALIESGKSFPSLRTMVKFTNIFSCKIQDLFLFENLQDSKVLKQELQVIIDNSNFDKVKTIYTIAKEL